MNIIFQELQGNHFMPHGFWDSSETPCYAIEHEGGASPFLFVCEHASCYIPAFMDNLGLEDAAVKSHIAWDIGALEVARTLSAAFDATLIYQKISRLVYDCNRPPQSPTAMPVVSEIYRVPGNENLSERERFERLACIYVPFHQAVDHEIVKRRQRQQETIFVTIHSFTPIWHGKKRDCQIGFLYELDDASFGRHLLEKAWATGRYDCRENEPYGPEDGQTMHTIRLHTRPNGLKNVMIEIRHDLIAAPDGVNAVSSWLTGLFEEVSRGACV